MPGLSALAATGAAAQEPALIRGAFAIVAVGLVAGCAPRAPRPNLALLPLVTVDGEPFAFSEKAGRVLLVTYFATWCFPCVAEVPDLVRLQEKYAARGFSVIAIGLDPQGAKVLRPFRDYYRLPYPVLLGDPDALGGKTPFGAIVGLPTSFILDREGRLVRSIYGFLDSKRLTEEVERVLE